MRSSYQHELSRIGGEALPPVTDLVLTKVMKIMRSELDDVPVSKFDCDGMYCIYYNAFQNLQ